MRTTEALRTMLLELAQSDDNTEEGQAHQDRADDAIAILMHNRMAAGTVMSAMASLIVFNWFERADQLDPDEAVKIFSDRPAGGERIPHLKDFMQSFVDGYRRNEKVSARSALIAAQITLTLEYTGLILWLLGVALTIDAPEDTTEREQYVDSFIASCLRQQIIVDDELDPPPPPDFT